MKKVVNLMAYAAIVLGAVMMSMSFASCDSKMDMMLEDATPRDTIPTPKDTTKVQPEVDPTWRWNTLMRRNLDFNVETEIVKADNICQLTNSLGDAKLDTISLVYPLEISIEAPSYVRLTSEKSDTTVLGMTKSASPSFGQFIVSKKDSVCSVTTGHTFQTSHYNIDATTKSERGYCTIAGHSELFKFVTEKAQWASVWNEYVGEVEDSDSIFGRYNVHNNMIFVVTGNDGQKWQITREKVVVVDHFLRMKEKEQPTVTADYFVKGLGKMVSLTRGIYSTTANPKPEDRHPFNAGVFEGEDGYTVIVDIYSNENKYLKTEVEYHSYQECPKTDDNNGVAYVNGHFYPGMITYHQEKSQGGYHDWEVVAKVNGEVKNHYIIGQEAVNAGIKNFIGDNNAYPSPYLTNLSTSEEVNGKMVWHVQGARSTGDATRAYVVADSLLQK